MSDGGKGSGRRPREVSDQQFTENWERIFGKKKDEKSDENKTSDDQQK